MYLTYAHSAVLVSSGLMSFARCLGPLLLLSYWGRVAVWCCSKCGCRLISTYNSIALYPAQQKGLVTA